MTGNSVTAPSLLRSASGMLSGLRGDGTAWLLIGSLVAGLLAYVFSVAGGRVLGSAAFAPIANLWTLQYVIMAILLFAIEQYEVRAVAAGGGDVRALHGAWPILWAIVIAVAAGATVLLFVFADKLLLGQADLALVGGAWVITAGAFGMVRGIYGGRAEYRLSGIATAADWIARIAFALLVLVVAALATTRNLAWTLPAGAVPFLAWWWLRGRHARVAHTTTAPARARPGSYLAGLSFANGSLQLMLGIGPLVVVALGESPSAVSAFFVTAALARAPFLIGIGFVPRVLTPLTRLAEAGDYGHVRAFAWLVVAGTVALAAIAGVAAFFLGPPIVSLLYGSEFALTDVATAGAVAAVIVALGALGLNQVVLAEGRPLALVPAWTMGLIAAAAVVVLMPLDPLPRVALAMLVGQLVAVVCLAAVVTSARGRNHASWLIGRIGVALASLLIVGCAYPVAQPTTTPSPVAAIRYVALGDSYTIGTSVGESERWPNQLVDRLAGTAHLELVANLGVNGYASANLIGDELPQLDALRPDFVTVLIGVNDVVRGTPADAYRTNVAQIFDFLLETLPADRIVVVSTPDYTRTPAGASFGDPDQQRAAIEQFNGIEREAAQIRGICFVDISSVADRADVDATLVARDGLHPSGAQYSGWVDLIAPVVERLLSGG